MNPAATAQRPVPIAAVKSTCVNRTKKAAERGRQDRAATHAADALVSALHVARRRVRIAGQMRAESPEEAEI